jgi:hypothetical protein
VKRAVVGRLIRPDGRLDAAKSDFVSGFLFLFLLFCHVGLLKRLAFVHSQRLMDNA